VRPLLSVRDLAARLGVRIERLYEIAEELTKDSKSHYSEFSKITGSKVRKLTVPDEELKEIQRRIKNKILAPIHLESAHGGVRNRSTVTNASEHLGQHCLVNVDVKDFFPSIRPTVVCKMFRHDLGFGRDVASLLTKLTTIEFAVPQGAPTSTAIANLVLLSVDESIAAQAKALDVKYSRYVDDVSLSGQNPRELINPLGKLLSRKGLSIHRKNTKWIAKSKLKITHAGNPQEVTGLGVNSKIGPSVSRSYRSDVRRAIFNLSRIANDAELLKAKRSIRGKIQYVRQFNPGSARRLEAYLDARI
jgi:RNA-directed DNA polymerase